MEMAYVWQRVIVGDDKAVPGIEAGVTVVSGRIEGINAAYSRETQVFKARSPVQGMRPGVGGPE